MYPSGSRSWIRSLRGRRRRRSAERRNAAGFEARPSSIFASGPLPKLEVPSEILGHCLMCRRRAERRDERASRRISGSGGIAGRAPKNALDAQAISLLTDVLQPKGIPSHPRCRLAQARCRTPERCHLPPCATQCFMAKPPSTPTLRVTAVKTVQALQSLLRPTFDQTLQPCSTSWAASSTIMNASPRSLAFPCPLHHYLRLLHNYQPELLSLGGRSSTHPHGCRRGQWGRGAGSGLLDRSPPNIKAWARLSIRARARPLIRGRGHPSGCRRSWWPSHININSSI